MPILHAFTSTTFIYTCINYFGMELSQLCSYTKRKMLLASIIRENIEYTKTAKLFSQPTLIQLRKLNASIQRSNTLTFQ